MSHSILRQLGSGDLAPGKTLALSKTITEDDLVAFAKVSLDANPLHFSEELAQKTRFGGRIVHGMLTASLFSGILCKLAPWCVYLKQGVEFLKPVRIGDTITVTGRIESIGNNGLIETKLVGTNQSGETVIIGFAQMKKLKEMYKD